MSANERQVGGNHYKRDVQHWDLMAMANANYFAGQVTKYTERHVRKNGREDLEKALHFAEKMHEVRPQSVKVPQYRRGFLGRKILVEAPQSPPENPALIKAVRDYSIVADLSAIQERIFELCLLRPDRTEEIVSLCRMHLTKRYGPQAVATSVGPKGPIPVTFTGELTPAREVMRREMLDKYEGGPPTPEDGGQHGIPAEVEDRMDADVAVELADAIASQRPTVDKVVVSQRTPPEKTDSRRR